MKAWTRAAGRCGRAPLALQLGAVALLVALGVQAASAGSLRDWWIQRRAERRQARATKAAEASPPAPAWLPAGARMLGDFAYGDDPLQKLDVYLPADATSAPVILMVHGGAWVSGDKRSPRVAPNKVTRWVPRGFIFVSVNYRLVPEVNPLEQAQDVARALAFAQARVASWGGESSKFILMGHSAGAHLVAVLAADPHIALSLGAGPWLGTISMDSAALDVPAVMERRHERFYDAAFGGDPAFWKVVSPIDLLSRKSTPMLAVCSSIRPDHPCAQAKAYAAKAAKLGVRVEVLPEARRHGQINEEAGKPGAYTDALEAFMGSLDPAVKRLLAAPPK